MVTETKDNMNKMFDTLNENMGAAIDAGVQIQRAWTEALGTPEVVAIAVRFLANPQSSFITG